MSSDQKGISELYREMHAIAASCENLPDPHALDCLERGFERFAQLVTLFLVSERDTYYGYFFMAMTFRANPSMQAIAGILLDAYPPVFEANPLELFKLSLKEILYAFCHEVDHVVFNHPAEMVKANPERDPELFKLFNYAADASVNDQLNYEIECGRKFLSAPRGIITSEYLAKRYVLPNVASRQDYLYYFNLLKDVVDASSGEPDNDESQSAQPDSPNDEELSIGNHAWESTSDDDEGVSGTLDDMLESATREFLNDVNELMGAEARSMMPALFTERIREINAPAKLNWKQILKQYVGTVSAEKIKTKSRLNRRQPLRYDLSGSRESKTLKIVVAIDTSASMDTEQLRRVFAEIFSIIASRRYELTVIECDAEVQRVYRIKSPDDVSLDVAGRGGTRFTPTIEYLNSHRYFRDALFIYFTDGFGEESIPRPRTYRNLWVILGPTSHLSVERPYGLVLPLED